MTTQDQSITSNVTASGPVTACGCGGNCCAPTAASTVERTVDWHRAARKALLLSWFSLAWMTAEGAIGLTAGYRAGSVSLIGWALSSVVEGLASIIVIWRLTGSRTLSATSERTAQKAIAVSFWLLAPYVALEAVSSLIHGDHPSTSRLGIGLTIASLLVMPLLGKLKHDLGNQLDSAATSGEGTQNLLCAYLAAAVLVGLVANSLLGAWWLDAVIALGVATVAVREGREAWRGEDCC